ncbi:MAG: type II CAAX endopeptidase family protein [Promethearchaeia archaeon]
MKKSSSNLTIIVFISISYFITWLILFPLAALYNDLNFVEREIWHSLGSIGPTIGGIIAIYLSNKKEGLLLLKERVLRYSGWKILLFAFSPLLILIVVLLFESLFGSFNLSTFLVQNSIDSILTFIIFLLPSFCYGFFEEIGWRGFLLPKFQTRFNAFISTLLLTIIWWFWHFPTFFYRFNLLYGLLLMFPLMLSGSIVLTFLFNWSKGSVLMVIILHISYDLVTSHEISIISIILVSAFYIFMDIRIIKVFGLENLSPQKRSII